MLIVKSAYAEKRKHYFISCPLASFSFLPYLLFLVFFSSPKLYLSKGALPIVGGERSLLVQVNIQIHKTNTGCSRPHPTQTEDRQADQQGSIRVPIRRRPGGDPGQQPCAAARLRCAETRPTLGRCRGSPGLKPSCSIDTRISCHSSIGIVSSVPTRDLPCTKSPH